MISPLEKTQKDLSLLFDKLLSSNSFPRVSLFSGPSFSGRMYASILISEKTGSDYSSTIILSDREFGRIIPAAIELYRKNRTYRAANFLKHNVSVFLSEFNGAMLESGSSTVKKKFETAGNCYDLISRLPDVPENEIESFCSSLSKEVANVMGRKTSTGAVTVGQVRNIKEWCSTSSLENKRKTVIIEGLENSLPATSNALLKILEEPPENTTFILISSNTSSIPPTILSRVRVFNFKALDKDALRYIFDSISLPPDAFKDYESFIWKYSGTDEELLDKSALSLVTTGKTDVRTLLGELEKSKSYDRFFYLVLKYLKDSIEPDDPDFEKKLYLYNELSTSISRSKTFNQNQRLVFDYIVYRTGEFIK